MPVPVRRDSTTAATTAAMAETSPPEIRLIRGPNCSAIQPISGEPIGAPPRNTSMYTPMTRPRIRGSVPSWVAEFAAVVYRTTDRPVGRSRRRKAQ